MIMRSIIFCLLVLASSQAAWAREIVVDNRVSPLAGYDFAAGGYSLVGRVWGGPGDPRHPVQKELGEFYVDDPALLEEIKAQWIVGERPVLISPCDYHYAMQVIRDRQVVGEFLISLENECVVLVMDGESLGLDAATLTRHADRYRKPVVESFYFNSLAEARDHLASLAGNERLLVTPDPYWRDYEGDFRFIILCPGHGYRPAKIKACIDKVRAEIETEYPGEKFDLTDRVGRDDRFNIEIKSSKALYARFDLYKINKGWFEYAPLLIVYWKQAE